MMFSLPDDHTMLQRTVRDWVRAEVAPHAAGWEETGVPDAVMEQVAELGLLGILAPERLGGAEMDALAYAVAVEELAVGDGGLALRVALHAGPCVRQLLDAGHDAQVEQLVGGEVHGAWGDGLVPSAASLVGGETLGQGGPAQRTYGMRSARLGRKVPGVSVLHSDGASRLADLGLAAVAVGLGRAGLEAGGRYALERKQFGRPIAHFQESQWKVANGATGLDAARLLTWRAAADPRTAAMARTWATRAAERATDDALQLHGGYGYTAEYLVERYWRDARFCRVGVGGDLATRLAVAERVVAAYS